MPFASLRLQGIREHLERAQFLFELAQQASDAKTRYRLMITTVYSCRAITELMLEAAEKQEIKHLKDPDPKNNRKALEMQIEPKLPFYALIERIRIHDFHRFGLVPPGPRLKQVMFGGPMQLRAQKGAAFVSVTSAGPQVSTTGNSQVKFQRPLLVQDGEFFDDDSKQYVSIEQVLKIYLEKISAAVSEFEGLLV